MTHTPTNGRKPPISSRMPSIRSLAGADEEAQAATEPTHRATSASDFTAGRYHAAPDRQIRADMCSHVLTLGASDHRR